MNQPISAGCLAEVVSGLFGKDSPNLGLVVKVLKYIGDDPHFGRIWRCQAEYAKPWAATEGADDNARTNFAKLPAGELDFAQDWLRRLPDPPAKTATTTTEKELTT